VASLLSTVALGFATSASAEEPIVCRDIAGSLRCNLSDPWDMCRIRTQDGAVYSLKHLSSADPALLDALKVAFNGGTGPLRGSFTVCITGRNPTGTYTGKPVYFANLTAFSLASPQ